jgi:hypothetical protein
MGQTSAQVAQRHRERIAENSHAGQTPEHDAWAAGYRSAAPATVQALREAELEAEAG